jgi:hypothetical protein
VEGVGILPHHRRGLLLASSYQQKPKGQKVLHRVLERVLEQRQRQRQRLEQRQKVLRHILAVLDPTLRYP